MSFLGDIVLRLVQRSGMVRGNHWKKDEERRVREWGSRGPMQLCNELKQQSYSLSSFLCCLNAVV